RRASWGAPRTPVPSAPQDPPKLKAGLFNGSQKHGVVGAKVQSSHANATRRAGMSPLAPSSHGEARRANAQRLTAGSARGVLFQEFGGFADGKDGLGGVVGNLAAELLFEGHHEFDRVETVRTEIVDEAGVFGHLLGFHSQMIDDDLFDP